VFTGGFFSTLCFFLFTLDASLCSHIQYFQYNCELQSEWQDLQSACV
jgi:hypothetical protein